MPISHVSQSSKCPSRSPKKGQEGKVWKGLTAQAIRLLQPLPKCHLFPLVYSLERPRLGPLNHEASPWYQYKISWWVDERFGRHVPWNGQNRLFFEPEWGLVLSRISRSAIHSSEALVRKACRSRVAVTVRHPRSNWNRQRQSRGGISPVPFLFTSNPVRRPRQVRYDENEDVSFCCRRCW